MKILLASNATYEPPRGGSTRSNLAWLRELAQQGHECRVVCPSSGDFASDHVSRDGITIHRIHELAQHANKLGEEIAAFRPDWVLVSSEDLSHTLLREAHRVAASRLVYLAHTPQFFPFGPESWNPDARVSDMVRQARAVIAIGIHMAGYIRQHLGREASVIHPPIYGEPPYGNYGSASSGDVLMINPCTVKGLPIFVELARRFPQITFAALAGWGTTSLDRRMMAEVPNIRVLESVPDINDVLKNARALAMPSLWYEGFGLIVIEAMLRGLPVIASDSGGLKEAKGPTGYVVPVRPVERYGHTFDEAHMPVPVLPEQDIEPWVEALSKLLASQEAYEQEAALSRRRASEFVSGLQPRALETLLASLETAPPMRVLLAHNSLYFPSRGGGDKSNRFLMEALAARGHSVRVCARIEVFGEEGHEKFAQELVERGVEAKEIEPGALRMELNGVDVRTLTRSPMWRAFFSQQIREFDPDVILTSTDDPAHLLLELALAAPRARVVHMIRATIAVPFGPHSAGERPERTEKLRRADRVVGVSESVARYAREYGGLDAIHVPISLPEHRNFRRLGRFDNAYVTMVNPCAVKGLSIFLDLARRAPHLRFAAVPTWGTNAQDYALLRSLPNVEILEARDNVDEIFEQTRVMLVPSLWAEARSRVVVEAMACGIPVMASDIGGIPEAKLGVPYLVPIRPIERYSAQMDENMVPIADVPEQDTDPWCEALDRLTSDPSHWNEIAEASFRAANEYFCNLSAEPFEAVLRDAIVKPQKERFEKEGRSAERERLLALRIRKHLRERRNLWFPALAPLNGRQTRMFLFPFAGAGALAWTGWQESLGDGISLCPVRLPGRENRAGEAAFEDMGELVQALVREMEPLLSEPFIFYGHSMGAAIAFELARELRRRGLPLPALLAVSGARAPQFRLHHVPPADPSDDELIGQVKELGGLPADQIDRSDALALVLPALRSDSRLFRRYTYSLEPPLAIPIAAYGGTSDPNVTREHLEAWREQTTRRFTSRFVGGRHFFIRSADFLGLIGKDLRELENLTV
ncbi:MAG: glycosyltransferase [Acidobacteria bacterium]|nr:glycosyltransferase [Acidobacteriota bacterium]